LAKYRSAFLAALAPQPACKLFVLLLPLLTHPAPLVLLQAFFVEQIPRTGWQRLPATPAETFVALCSTLVDQIPLLGLLDDAVQSLNQDSWR
jgi:hypothetical protein